MLTVVCNNLQKHFFAVFCCTLFYKKKVGLAFTVLKSLQETEIKTVHTVFF